MLGVQLLSIALLKEFGLSFNALSFHNMLLHEYVSPIFCKVSWFPNNIFCFTTEHAKIVSLVSKFYFVPIGFLWFRKKGMHLLLLGWAVSVNNKCLPITNFFNENIVLISLRLKSNLRWSWVIPNVSRGRRYNGWDRILRVMSYWRNSLSSLRRGRLARLHRRPLSSQTRRSSAHLYDTLWSMEATLLWGNLTNL